LLRICVFVLLLRCAGCVIGWVTVVALLLRFVTFGAATTLYVCCSFGGRSFVVYSTLFYGRCVCSVRVGFDFVRCTYVVVFVVSLFVALIRCLFVAAFTSLLFVCCCCVVVPLLFIAIRCCVVVVLRAFVIDVRCCCCFVPFVVCCC